MNVEQRINLLVKLGSYLKENNEEWVATKANAYQQNSWFVPMFINIAIANICEAFLQKNKLTAWANAYGLTNQNIAPKSIGLVMAGNIPLVGFHDFICCFISGHKLLIKPSSKDDILIQHLATKMGEWDAETNQQISFAERLVGCDAYIATGSNNSSRYFEYYFAKYPHIIRRNKTSIAVLTGLETADELLLLADDIMLYFGLGCRNVTQLLVPVNYNFIPLLAALKKYSWAADHNKYRNNYDYNLALHMLNGTYYMTNEFVLLIEHPSAFSPISQLHYQFYTNAKTTMAALQANDDVQAFVGYDGIHFGKAQQPQLADYADGIDTMQWLINL